MRSPTHSRAARRVAVTVLAGSLTVILGTPAAQARAFGLDPSFAGGKVLIDVGSKDLGGAVAIQPDGDTVVLGGIRRSGGSTDTLVARLEPDGRPDPGFGVAGQVLLVGQGTPVADGLAIQPDGRILVTGTRTIRLLADGQLDPDWGAAGPVAGGVAVAVQPDGQVVVADRTAGGLSVARLNPDGTPDQGFGVAGKTLSQFPPDGGAAGNDIIRALALGPDGTVVVAGSTGERFGLLRLTPDGRPDPTFGNGGHVVTSMNAGATWRGGRLQDIAIQGDGRIVAAGSVYTNGPTGRGDVAVARYRTDGTLDNTFGTGGLVLAQGPPAVDPKSGGQFSGNSGANSVTIDAAGRPVVVGGMMGVAEGDLALVRFTAGGVLDSTFNGNGWVRTDTSGGQSDWAEAVALDGDGRIVVAGTSDGVRAGDVVVVRVVDADPAGLLESLKVKTATRVASVSGWAADGDASSPVSVRIHVDGVARSTVVAREPRPDVDRADARGFAGDLLLGPGNHSLCAYAVNQGVGADTLLGCKSVIVSSDPFGSLDTVGRRPGGVLVSGWAIDPDVSGAVAVYVYVDGTFRQALTADQLRADVGGAFPGTGNNHGYQGVIPVGAGTHNVCTFVLNQGPGTNQLLGCKNVWVTFDPIGSLEVGLSMGGQVGVGVRGWAIDPDVAGPVTVYVYVDGAFIGTTPANKTRIDVDAVIPGYGVDHGFEAFLPGAPGGLHTICAFGINQAAGYNSLLGCILG